jgi:pilus assembly protein CpaE
MDDLAANGFQPEPNRDPRAIVYVRDKDSEGVIRQALSDLGAGETIYKPGGVMTAQADITSRHSPQLLVVDIAGESDPVARIRELVNACDPSTRVLVIGEDNDIRLYRDLREAGAEEYFFKPLVTAVMTRACKVLLGENASQPQSRTGRIVFVAGVRGGVGGTTIAVRTAMRLSESPPRPVILLDLDLQSGDAALQLDATPGHALREALERADRVDNLFLERGIVHVTKRLDLFASLEPIEEPIPFQEETLLALLDTLSRRYRYVVVDVPMSRAFNMWRALHLPSVLLLVSDGRLVSARDVARWRRAIGPNTPDRSTLHLLNMNGASGSLTVEEFTKGAGAPPDVIIPYARDTAANSNLSVLSRPEGTILDHGLNTLLRQITGEQEPVRRSFFAKLMS